MLHQWGIGLVVGRFLNWVGLVGSIKELFPTKDFFKYFQQMFIFMLITAQSLSEPLNQIPKSFPIHFGYHSFQLINSSTIRNPLTESTDVLERLMCQRNPATRFVESEKITVRKGRKVKNLSIRTKSNTAWRKTIGISQTLFSAVNQEREKLQKIAQV